MFETVVAYTTKNDGYQKNGSLQVKGLMLHSTATPGIMALEFRERFNKPGLEKSIHGFLDDACYVQCMPYEKKAGHCRYAGNSTHIGIELCEPKEWQTDAVYFAKVYENAVALFAQLCRQFDLTEQDIIDQRRAIGWELPATMEMSGTGFRYLVRIWMIFGRMFEKCLNNSGKCPLQSIGERISGACRQL